MRQLFCSRAASSAGQTLTRSAKFIPMGGLWAGSGGGPGTQLRLSMPLKLQDFIRSSDLWQYYFRYLRVKERASAAFLGVLGMETPPRPRKPRRKNGSGSLLRDTQEKFPEPCSTMVAGLE